MSPFSWIILNRNFSWHSSSLSIFIQYLSTSFPKAPFFFVGELGTCSPRKEAPDKSNLKFSFAIEFGEIFCCSLFCGSTRPGDYPRAILKPLKLQGRKTLNTRTKKNLTNPKLKAKTRKLNLKKLESLFCINS